jgi:hypothetical protein
VGHSASEAARTEATPFARKRYEALMPTQQAREPQGALFQLPAIEIFVYLLLHEAWKPPDLIGFL